MDTSSPREDRTARRAIAALAAAVGATSATVAVLAVHPHLWAVAGLALLVLGSVANSLLRPSTATASAHAGRWRRLLRLPAQALRLVRTGWMFLAVGGAVAASIVALAAVFGPHAEPTRPQLAAQLFEFFPIGALAAAFLGYFIDLYHRLQASDRDHTADDRLAVGANRLLAAVMGALGALLLVERYAGLVLHRWVLLAVAALTLGWALEITLRWALRLYQPPRVWRQGAPLGTARVLRLVLRHDDVLFSRSAGERDASTLRLAEMWFLPEIVRSLVPLGALTLVLLWLSTAVHEVPLGSSGLRQHLGRTSPEAHGPGLHLTLPWPLDTFRLFPTTAVQEVVLGLESDPGEAILWDRQHYVGEKSHLVGDGEELLTISVPIFYRIRDPYLFFRNTQDGAETMRQLGLQTLLHATLERPAFAIMTSERENLRRELETTLQDALDARDSGLEVVMVALRDIHPPVPVAPFYQEVVSALEDREAYIHEGEDYHARTVPQARARRTRDAAAADQSYGERVADARGEAHAFDAVYAAYRESPYVFEVRRFYDAFDESLTGVKKLLVDDSFAGGIPTFIDVRQTLNPNYVDTSLPPERSLVPVPKAKPSEFDRLIDGQRRAGLPAEGERPLGVLPGEPDWATEPLAEATETDLPTAD